MSAIIVTGAGGFVGRRLVDRLVARGDAVTGIGRGEQPADWPKDARWVRADLNDAASYENALSGADCVIHLAAITGKARPAAYRRGNVEATRALAEASARAGVKRIVFVSSIAAAFADRRHYPYAESKIAAEAVVREVPMPWVIVRPTMVLGPGSPIEDSLARLARFPVSPVFGDGRRQVEPVDVDDVADFLDALAHAPDVAGETIELGGGARFDMRDLYARLRAQRGGAGAPRFAPLPLGFFRFWLAAVEGPLLPVLPLTAGQLATFANDGIAAPHPIAARLLPHPRPADAEMDRHARYVAGANATTYQRAKYRDFHARHVLQPISRFDALLLRLSRMGGVGLALADSYTGLLYRRSVVRAKLVLTLAILESSAPSFAELDKPGTRGPLAYLSMGLRGAMAAFSIAIAALFLLPAQLLLGARPAQ